MIYEERIGNIQRDLFKSENESQEKSKQIKDLERKVLELKHEKEKDILFYKELNRKAIFSHSDIDLEKQNQEYKSEIIKMKKQFVAKTEELE